MSYREVVVSHAATQLNLCVDPDGIGEDRGSSIAHKLVTLSGHQLDNPSLLYLTSSDISVLPIITHIDIYNSLKVTLCESVLVSGLFVTHSVGCNATTSLSPDFRARPIVYVT